MANVKEYIPKKYWKDIERTNVEVDYNYGTNRTVQLYTVDFKDGSRIAEQGIKNLKRAIKIKYKGEDEK